MSAPLPLTSKPTTALSGLPRTAASHFRLHLYATIFRILYYLRSLHCDDPSPLQRPFEQHPFLAHYFNEILQVMPQGASWEDGLVWWTREIDAWEAACGDPLPLRRLTDDGGLPPPSLSAFLLAGLVEEDARFGSFFGAMQSPLPHRRPCLELIGRIARIGREDLDAWQICRPLLDQHLALPETSQAPRAEWTLRVPGVLWDAARGTFTAQAPFEHHDALDYPPLDALILRRDFHGQVVRLPSLLTSEQADALILRGVPGSDRLTVLGAVARALGRSVLQAPGGPPADNSLLAPLCTLIHAMPVLSYDLGPGETVAVPALPGYRGPVSIMLGPEGGLEGPAIARAVTLRMPLPRRTERLRFWQETLDVKAGPELQTIAARFQIPGGYIRQAAPVARAQAALEGREHVLLQDALVACRALNRQQLDALAEPLETQATWSELVMHSEGQAKLRELERRCRYREVLLEHLGLAFSGTNRGVRALFSGPSGTGKTLAARILANELGIDLYRLDLAAVINKYIGETEKNLHRILAVAEALDVMLLIDEGDALLGSRTDVKSANDRYANLETNYLLQRLEHYNGVVVVTTNLGENIDRAFQRRMDVTVNFLPPQAQERLQIWHLHLPDQHNIDAEYLDEVAVRCRLTGGQIRNAALHGTLLALEEAAPIARRHLEEAIRSEYRKAGATAPFPTRDGRSARVEGVEAFLSSFAR